MTVPIASPLAGWATPLDKVPDPVFSDRMLGDGIAIDPVEGQLTAPGNGVVTNIHPAGHAVTLTLDSGPVLLMHIGLDTVGLGGAGFSPLVTEGQRVAAGDTLIRFDLDQLARTARSLITPVIVTNGEAFRIVSRTGEGVVAPGAPLLTLEAVATGEPAKYRATTSGPQIEQTIALPLAQGLHARPAARIAKLASDFDADIALCAEGGHSASARSSVAMLGLALTHGASVSLRATGPDAGAAVNAIVALIESGMGELLPVGTAVAQPRPVPALPDTLTGVVAAPGMAIGPAFRLNTEAIAVPETGENPAGETRKLEAAKAQVRAALETEAAGDGPQAEIAAAHGALLDDPTLDEAARSVIAAGKSAGFAWRQAIDRAARPLRSTGNKRFAERLDDLADLEHRVQVALLGEAAQPTRPPEGAILVAETLYPSQLMALADAGLSGIATAQGGATSHVAIIAAGLGLPLLAALGPALGLVEDGTDLILTDGTLHIAPGKVAIDRARAASAARAARRRAARARADESAVTTDGTRIEVVANLGSVADAQSAVSEGAEGCGLLRTEFLFLDRAAPPDEAEQRATYQQIADTLGERPLIVRTLDIGADKPAPWLPMADEENPALGLRGIRLQLARRDLLETQFRALLGVEARGRLRIMLPMVAAADELREAHALLHRLAGERGVSAPELGIMVETPAAALTAETLAREAVFFSIGSNDLSQYALARDRTNPAVAAGLDGLHPAVLRLIDATVRGGRAHDRWTGVCGGLAAVPEAVPILIGLGVTELSVPAAAVAEIKALIRTLDLNYCRTLAARALTATDAAAVRALVEPLLEQAA
ncbi:phosphoenolpyruvate--protein phosphotransferase [Stakelama sediminis]|uniref:phosphoenolpyruvate--protein phosphotransferase n=1 Tax=Stakelama sediminis TaxID=463200 RepID=A0A840YY56_9SPHN|nr:phosphoenolpyruvate--protein phosphotransferase [Stakelama sediminis]MBB5718446.1 phosphocarrier protein FPr/phosphocarrier protein [Stakelama sediminis]